MDYLLVSSIPARLVSTSHPPRSPYAIPGKLPSLSEDIKK
jgi:hypothetical protein